MMLRITQCNLTDETHENTRKLCNSDLLEFFDYENERRATTFAFNT